jgi:Protein of unknown function (DUF3306)
MSDGFLGRWSRRKLEVKEGKAVEAEPAVQAVPPTQPSGKPPGSEVASGNPGATGVASGGDSAEALPLPTLEDVKALTGESDFSRFAAPGVAPEVKNAALKKLFSDPHYNVMDRLDVYIDDYSQPDPMPNSMVRQLASVKFLGLFAPKAEAEPARDAPVVVDSPTAQTVAQSEGEPLAVPQPPDHADPDLRLQQDNAAPGEAPGHGAE